MKVMHKFELRGQKTVLHLAAGSIPRHVHEQNGGVMLWIELDLATPGPSVARAFAIEGTGCGFERGDYLGTAHVEGFVWHVFEVPV
jgi:hypothetical protein